MTSENTNAPDFLRQQKHMLNALQACDFSILTDVDNIASPLGEYFRYYGFANSVTSANGGYSVGVLHYDSLCLAAHWWQLRDASKTIVLAPGLFDHVGIYLRFVELLLAEGFNVFAVDFPGHGLSEGPRAEIGDFSEYVAVLDLCIAKIDSDKHESEILLAGQSTGGAAIAHYLMTGKAREQVAKAVLLAPLIKPKNWLSVNVAWLFLHVFIQHVPRRFAVNSNDKVFLRFLANEDPLQPRKISMRWIAAMRKWIARFTTFSRNAVPILIVQGDSDNTVDWESNIPMLQTRFSHSKVVMIAGAKHHLVNEAEHYYAQLAQAVSQFLATD